MSFVKKIHYCWLGSPVPDSVKQQVDKWRQMCPDFEFCEWNDDNISYSDYSDYPYWRRIYTEKRWGIASDIVRFAKLLEHGGFYLDCDVIMCKPLDTIPASGDHLIMGYMYDCAVSGGCFYSPAGHPLLQKLMEYYRDVNDGFYVVSNTILTDLLNNNVDEFLLNGKYFTSDKARLTVFPKEYFCQPSLIKSKPFALDQFAGSWKNGNLFVADRGAFNLLSILRRKVSCYRSLRRNEFYPIYKAALHGKKLQRTEHWRAQYGITGGAIRPVE